MTHQPISAGGWLSSHRRLGVSRRRAAWAVSPQLLRGGDPLPGHRRPVACRPVPARFAELMAARADTPFGDVELVSGRTLQPFSVAGHRAADNLLAKALRALEAGDPERARVLVDRAARLPYDRHEETCPAASQAHMALFNRVIDELEGAPAGDSRWLDAAVEVLATADDDGRCELRDVLVVVDKEYELTRHERATLRAAVADVPPRPELSDLRPEPEELATLVLSALDTCRRYAAALEAPAG